MGQRPHPIQNWTKKGAVEMALKQSLDNQRITWAWNCLSGIRRQADIIKDALGHLVNKGVDVAYLQRQVEELEIAAKVQAAIFEVNK